MGDSKYKINTVYRPSDTEQFFKEIVASASFGNNASGPSFYCLSMFPYPSGNIHMGHVRNYVLGDVITRYKRMSGYNVFQPFGWDAFGLPAENAAALHGVNPQEWTAINIDTMRSQLKEFSFSFNWESEVQTCDAEYYRNTQDLFLKMYAKGIAYRKKGVVNWCVQCSTVLANEQVQDDKCWRCNTTVTNKRLTQWYFRTTEYKDRLLSGLDSLDWPDHIKTMQRNWISSITDWCVSRQRKWGTPIPIIHCPDCGEVPINTVDLPVLVGDSVDIECPDCDKPSCFDQDTMDTFVDSSWYFVNFLNNSSFDTNLSFPVDQYIGGIEHATMHLIYARFMTMVMYDLGIVEAKEPFKKLLAQGMVLKDGIKMSKSKGNVVGPDEVIRSHGVDATRLFILFAAPPTKDLEWSDKDISGCSRFLERLYDLLRYCNGQPLLDGSIHLELGIAINKFITKMTDGMDSQKFNTCVSTQMEFLNLVCSYIDSFGDNLPDHAKSAVHHCLNIMSRMLLPFAPHAAIDLSTRLSNDDILIWPEVNHNFKDSLCINMVVQVNGKTKRIIEVKRDSSESDVLDFVYVSKVIPKHDKPTKIIFKQNKIINLVIK